MSIAGVTYIISSFGQDMENATPIFPFFCLGSVSDIQLLVFDLHSYLQTKQQQQSYNKSNNKNNTDNPHKK